NPTNDGCREALLYCLMTALRIRVARRCAWSHRDALHPHGVESIRRAQQPPWSRYPAVAVCVMFGPSPRTTSDPLFGPSLRSGYGLRSLRAQAGRGCLVEDVDSICDCVPMHLQNQNAAYKLTSPCPRRRGVWARRVPITYSLLVSRRARSASCPPVTCRS